jgi:hypothetical protein
MATATTHKGYTAAISSVLTTELNALANVTNTAASAAIDNSTNLDLYMDLELVLAVQGAARTTAQVAVYITPSLDGTNYADVSELSAELVGVFWFTLATAAQRVVIRDIPIPPGLFKLFARNITGQTLAATTNTLKARYHSVLST